MFDVGASEFLLIVVVAIVVIGPKDLPMALRTAGRWMGKMRRISGHFRTGIETMIREAELEDMEKKWREQNQAIMNAQASEIPMAPEEAPGYQAEPAAMSHDPALLPSSDVELTPERQDDREAAPQLPLSPP